MVGQGEEDVVQVGGVHGELGRFDARPVELVQQRAQRPDPAVAGHLEGQVLVVAADRAECLGGQVEFGQAAEAQAHVAAGNQLLQFGRSALGDEPALVQHGDPVGQLVGLLQVLRGEQDGDTVLADQVVDDLPHGAPAARVEPGGWLVQEDDPGLADQRHGQIQPPPHAPGISSQRFAGRLGQIEFLQQLGGALPRLALTQVVQLAHQHQILGTGEQSVHGGELPSDADRGTHRVRLPGQLLPGYPGLARVRLAQRGQDAHGRRLPGPIRAEQREDRALLDVQVDAVEHELVLK